MSKKIILSVFGLCLAFVGCLWNTSTAQAASHNGQIVKMDGLSTLYYVASDGKRYVFPNEKIYSSWFIGFNDVVTLSQAEIVSLPLGGNVVYRPGALLVKITTDPKVYAVSKNGALRWMKTEAIAKALYGDNWSKLVDDVPDSFFTNYTIGAEIAASSDFNPDTEADVVDTIEANRGMSTANAKHANTAKCRALATTNGANHSTAYARDCVRGSVPATNTNDASAPVISSIKATNNGEDDYIDEGDYITIVFNEAIDPKSINSSLSANDSISGVIYSKTGGVSLSSAGVVTIKNIATFDIGDVEDSSTFTVKQALDSTGKILTITLTAGDEVEIGDEDFSKATQVGGTVKDTAGNLMVSNSSITTPTGNFGGFISSSSDDLAISSIKAYNDGEDDYIDEDDYIVITFNAAIDPETINEDLDTGDSVNGVIYSKTGGVSVSSAGKVTIKNIATFDIGDVEDSENYTVKLALNSTGKILTITLTSGDAVEITDEDFGGAAQVGGTVEDEDGNEMESDSSISDPLGSFAGDDSSSDAEDAPAISSIKVYNDGEDDYIDEDDYITITFDSAIDPETINEDLDTDDSVSGVTYSETGGVSVSAAGKVTIKNIATFYIGDVEDSGNFTVKLALNATGKILTITLTSGDEIEITDEDFSNATQAGGTLANEDGVEMESDSSITTPTGSFAGDSSSTSDEAPYISSIKIFDNGEASGVNESDSINIIFSEAINPKSINSSLNLGGSVSNVDADKTGGVTISSSGILTIAGIASFDIGDVEDNTEFIVKLAMTSTGKVLVITLTDGDEIEIDENFSNTKQISGTVEDTDGNEMASDDGLSDPTGSFGE